MHVRPTNSIALSANAPPGWDIGHHDYTSIWFWQRLVGCLRIVQRQLVLDRTLARHADAR
jgi:hypothetical protein